MTTLLSLIGEQPIPNLLVQRFLGAEKNLLCYSDRTAEVARRLQTFLPGADIHRVEPYDIARAYEQISKLCSPETIINLTGGTKPMVMAAFEYAQEHNLACVYLESEQRQSILHTYQFIQGKAVRGKVPETLPALITIEDYLQVHRLPASHKGVPQNSQEAGLRAWFEKHTDECWSFHSFPGFEIDFILRRKNQVAIVEAKMTGKNTRYGIDQLNTAGGKTYLGTYTGKLHIVTRPLGRQLSLLAEARQIKVVVVSGSVNPQTDYFMLDVPSRNALLNALDSLLGT